MTRTALVANGRVEHVVVAGPGYRPPPGMTAVISDTANIGDSHDGATFRPPAEPQLPAARLIAIATRRRVIIARTGILFDVAKAGEPTRMVRISTTAEHRSDIAELAWLAERNSLFTAPWVDAFGTAMLDAAQILELRRKIAAHVAASYASLDATLTAIGSGAITTRAQINNEMRGID
jgi:hypothetical protein